MLLPPCFISSFPLVVHTSVSVNIFEFEFELGNVRYQSYGWTRYKCSTYFSISEFRPGCLLHVCDPCACSYCLGHCFVNRAWSEAKNVISMWLHVVNKVCSLCNSYCSSTLHHINNVLLRLGISPRFLTFCSPLSVPYALAARRSCRHPYFFLATIIPVDLVLSYSIPR